MEKAKRVHEFLLQISYVALFYSDSVLRPQSSAALNIEPNFVLWPCKSIRHILAGFRATESRVVRGGALEEI